MAKTSAEHHENGTDTKVTTNGYPQEQKKGGKVKRHFKRFWWIYVLLFIIIFLVVFLPIAYVAVPKMAQDGVDESTLEIVRFSALDPTPDSVYLSQEFIIRSDNHFHPHLEAFNAEIGLEGDEAYASPKLPPTDSGDEVPGSFAQQLDITNQDAFKRYNRALLLEKEITTFVRGKTTLHQGGFPATEVNYDKKAKIKGFNSLSGFALTSFHVSGEYARDGTNANGTVTIPNASDITVDMGNVTFNNYVGDTLIGNNTIYNLILRPGANNLPLVGFVDLLAVIGLVGPNTTYEGRLLPVTIVGNSSVHNGQHLEFYEYALKGLNQSVELNTTRALSNEE